MPKVKGTAQLRRFCLTWNNYPEKWEELLSTFPLRYFIVGKEIAPTTGTPHLQGYVELLKPRRFGSIITALPGVHIERADGTAAENRKYCTKDGDFKEFGKAGCAGYRSDIESMYAMVKDGKTDVEIQETLTSQYVKYYRAIDRMRFNLARADRIHSEVEVHVYWGKAGTGKTRLAYEVDPDLYRVDTSSNQLWFDGYQGQATILFDDFYGGIKYGNFLQLIDRYKYQLPVKGGFTWKQWSRVIITSNKAPSEWYSIGLTPALERRLTLVREVGD